MKKHKHTTVAAEAERSQLAKQLRSQQYAAKVVPSKQQYTRKNYKQTLLREC
jgi:hypothetical protein